MNTGENEQALRKIIDMTRLISIVILVLNFYYYCYETMKQWEFAVGLVDRVMLNIVRTGLFDTIWNSKLFSLGLLVVSLIGARGKKEEKISLSHSLILVVA